MTTTNTTTSNTGSATCTPTAIGTTCAVNDITTPGSYVCNWNGSLLRVDDTAFDRNGSFGCSYESNETLNVTFISEDPNCTTSYARSAATKYYGGPYRF